MKKALPFLLSCTLAAGMAIPARAAEFPDTKGHWAESAIARWSGHGVVSGHGDGSFAPDDAMTRSQLAQVLAQLEKDGEGFLQVLQLTQRLLRIQLEQSSPALPQKQEIRVLELLEQARLRLSGNAHKGLTGAWLAIRLMEAVSMP